MNRSRRLLLTVAAVATMLVGSSLPAAAAPGDVDESFGTLGLLTIPVTGVGGGVGITRGPEGRFVVSWAADDQVGVSGFVASGEPDGGFGSGGSSSITVPGATNVDVSDSVVDGNGRTVVVGFAYILNLDTVQMMVARFTESGDPDTTFSGDGVRTVGFARGEAYAYDVAFRGGKIYVCGQAYSGTSVPADPVVVRLNGAGALDPAFGSGGRRTFKVPDGIPGDDFAIRILPVADGRFFLAGGAGTGQGFNTLLMRIHGDGRVDRSFKGDGFHIMNLRKVGSDAAVDAERDGAKIVLAVTGNSASEKAKIVRLWADGVRDVTFSGDGVVTYPLFGVSFLPLREIEVDANHRVYATPQRANLPVFRVRANGQLGTGFGDGGLAANAVTNVSAWDVMLRGDVVYVAGATSGQILVTRYLV